MRILGVVHENLEERRSQFREFGQWPEKILDGLRRWVLAK